MASTRVSPTHPFRTAPIRTAIVRVTIGSFSAAALMGVLALLGGGTFGATEGRILLTTLVVGVVSVAVLCYLGTAGTAYQPVGVVGGVVVLVPLVTVLVMIWAYFDTDPPMAVVKTFGVGAILAATLAQASLLLVMTTERRTGVRRLLVGTLVMAAVLAGLLSALVLGLDPRGGYLRLVGVAAILDVLGTVVVAALSRFGVHPVAAAPVSGPVVLDHELAARLDTFAARSGRTRDEVVATALTDYLAGRAGLDAPGAAAPVAGPAPTGH